MGGRGGSRRRVKSASWWRRVEKLPADEQLLMWSDWSHRRDSSPAFPYHPAPFFATRAALLLLFLYFSPLFYLLILYLSVFFVSSTHLLCSSPFPPLIFIITSPLVCSPLSLFPVPLFSPHPSHFLCHLLLFTAPIFFPLVFFALYEIFLIFFFFFFYKFHFPPFLICFSVLHKVSGCGRHNIFHVFCVCFGQIWWH